ncbi:DUF485 domain-containing protein [Streptomyces sp. NPDC005931]|uniref:DUF485 domain-containing protein n=1 Tax=Streptomyces sp. NPDC005931 TaxID=3364737 RepID=UPI00368B55A0
MSHDPYPPRSPSPPPPPWGQYPPQPPSPWGSPDPYGQPRAQTPPPRASSPSYSAHPWPHPAPPTEPPAPDGHHSDLRLLRSAYRWQRRVATLAALGYFVLFLILSAYAPSFMTGTVTEGIPTGLLLALIQVPVTWLAIVLYENTARRHVDPLAARIRERTEREAVREGVR